MIELETPIYCEVPTNNCKLPICCYECDKELCEYRCHICDNNKDYKKCKHIVKENLVVLD